MNSVWLCYIIINSELILFDCAADLAARYQISKYPTLKMFRYGQPTKREYRGQRSVESLGNFIEDQLLDPIVKVSNMDELKALDVSSYSIA